MKIGNVVEKVECLSLQVSLRHGDCLHQGFQVGHTQELLIFLVDIENYLSSPPEGVSSRIREDLKGVTSRARSESVLNRVGL